MSTTINTGWLKDNNGEKFAPKTLVSQVVTADGTTLETKIENDLASLDNSKADVGHTHDDKYDEKGSASYAENNAKAYTDEKLASIPTVDGYTKSEIDGYLDNKADKDHTHDLSAYATKEDANTKYDSAIDYIDTTVSGKADKVHNHNDIYYTETEIDTKLESKSDTSHNHDAAYDAKGSASAVQTNLNTVSDTIDSHIDDSKVHVTETEKATWNSKSNFSGNYNDLTNKPTISASAIGLGNVNNTSDANKPVSTAQQTAIDTALATAKSYTDTKTNGMATTTVVDNKISTHNTNTSAHSDIRELITGLTTRLNTLADSDDTTLDQMSEIVTYIKSNKSLIDSITTSKINVSDIVNNLTTNVSNKPLSAAQGVAIKALIDALQTAVNGKSDSGHTHDDRYYTESEINTKLSEKANTSHGNHVPTTETANNAKFLRNDNTWQTVTPENIGAAKASHGTHVSYSTTAPVMDGTAAVGSASTVARSDHKHPTDTSRASKTEFDTHVADTTKHITSTERTNWNAAKTHADSTHAPVDAQKNQNAFSNIKVGSTTISADNATDTLELVGSNVTITPDATNDKVTIAVADGTTSVKGIVKLTNSTSSTSTETAATPSSVKSAYDLANQAKTAATNAQTKADSAYNLANSKVDSLSDLGITATATELNYVDGVTSNVQTQLNSKTKVVKLTQAEYDALPSSKNSDGILYAITDGESSSGGGNTTSVELTQMEYDALVENGTVDNEMVYYIKDSEEPNIVNDLVNIIYPIGSIYMSVNNVNPTSLFGGTWEQIKDRFLLSAGDTYENGVTGGEAEHTLTVNEMPSHAHPVSYQNKYPLVENGTPNLLSYADERTALFDINDTTSSAAMVASATGGSQAHNNMPPYLTVFVWKRIA